MTQEGRQWLYRTNIRCAMEWGAAMARLCEPDAPSGLIDAPFEATAWRSAIFVLNALRFNRPVLGEFLSERKDENG